MNTQPTQKEAYKLFHNGIEALARAERQGIRVDMEYCRQTQDELTEQIRNIEERFYDTKFYRHWKHFNGPRPNINSNQQLGAFLYRGKKLKPPKTTASGQGSTDEETLESFNIPEIKDLLQIRKLKKLRDTYLKGFVKEQVNGYMHPFFNLHLARTYRSSSSEPNFQNIPKRDKEAQKIVRKALYPRPGCQLLEVDYSSVEVCVSACYHKDPTMVKYIKDPSSDMHGDMAEQIFFLKQLDKSIPGHSTLRSATKNGFVFPQFYGDYYGNNAVSLACTWGELPEGSWKAGQGIEVEPGLQLSDHLRANGIRSLDEFTEHIKQIEAHFWKKRFRVYNKWKKKTYQNYEETGYVELLTGFRCWGPMSFNDVCNYPIQGAAFHCLMWAFIELDKELRKRKMKTKLVGQIHDAIVADVYPPELETFAKMLQEIMIDRLVSTWDWIVVPLAMEIDLGDVDCSWYELEPYKV